MLTSLLAKIAKWTYGKKLLSLLDKGNKRLAGHRSEILLGLLALSYGLEKLGIAPEGLTETLKEPLLGAMAVTMAEKARHALDVAEKVIPNK